MSRFPIATTVVTLGALAVSAAALVGAYAVIDQRAAQVLKDRPRTASAATKSTPSTDARGASRAGGASQPPRASAEPRSVSAPTTAAQTVGSAAVAPSVPPQQTMMGDSGEKKSRREARHHGRHERRSARRHSHDPAPQQEAPPQQAPQPAQLQAAQPPASPAPHGGAQSAFFFPFR